MANNGNNNQSYEEQIKASRRNLSRIMEERKRTCNHKPNNHGQVISIHDSKINVPGKKDLPDSTVICTRCEKYFESGSYSGAEIDSGLYMFTSMAEQVKLNANLSDEDKATLEEYYDALDKVAGFTNYYLNMVEKLANGGGKNKNRPRATKGHIGVSTNMFGGRGY